MDTHFIEAVTDVGNWGKFAVSAFTPDEWAQRSTVDPNRSLLQAVGWRQDGGYVMVHDLQTAEGAIFRLGGLARADLNKHRIHVCVLFEAMLEWLYDQWENRNDPDLPVDEWVAKLPHQIELTGIPLQLAGYRRPGPDPDSQT